jgi:HIV Tat-specific factor 1
VQVANKNGRVVVLKHMFTMKELEEDASLLLDLKEDVREECEGLGEVTNVVLYDVSLHSTFCIPKVTSQTARA